MIQLVLGQRRGISEDIVQILIFIIVIVAAVLKNLFAAKHQNKKQDQNQNKPVQQSSMPRKTSAGAEKARIQRERLEQMLEGILQPKRGVPQKTPPRPVQAKPQAAKSPVAVPVPVRTPAVTKVYRNDSSDSELFKEMSAPVRKAETDTILDKNAIKIDNQLEQIQQLQEEHIQEDQRHLVLHDKISSGKKSSGYIPSFSDSDDLRMAILYTEILGKPLSLREAEALYD